MKELIFFLTTHMQYKFSAFVRSRTFVLIIMILSIGSHLSAQTDIFRLMQSKDLTIDQIETLAEEFPLKAGESSLAEAQTSFCFDFCCNSFTSSSSACVDFESYSNGNLIPQGNPPFALFSGNSNQNASVVSTQANSGTKSIRLTSTSDIVYNINSNINTVTRIEWMTYIPSGKSGAFGFYTNNSNIYPLHVNYNSGTATMLSEISNNNNIELGTFAYSSGTWFKSVLIFFPGDKIEYWQNGVLRHTVTNYQNNQIGHLNFYFNPQSPGNTEFFIDDICYNEKVLFILCSDDYDPVCINGTEYPNSCYAAEAGYSDCEWIYGSCADQCDPCFDCFMFLQRFESTNIVDFTNNYCFEGIATLQTRTVLTYQWSVQNTAVTYTNGTSSLSANPSIIFPGPGTYLVCQKVYLSGVSVFECCQYVTIGGCSTPPVSFFTASYQSFNDVFVLGSNAGGNQLQWSFSDPGVGFWTGDEYSTNPVIIVPFGKCVSVCLLVSNACGSSTYCIELCSNHSSCTGTTPPVYITNAIVPEVNGKTVNISLPTPPGGGAPNYQWDFGDGTSAASQNISHTYPDYGNYTVCAIITVGCRTWCYCWCVILKPCPTVYEYNEGTLDFEFTGTEGSLEYTFYSSIPKAPGQSWLVNNVPVNGNSTTMSYIFPVAGNYIICFPYLGNDGCVYYKCIDVYVGNPFLCNTITWQFAATTGYRFSLPSGATEIEWTIDETGQQIGQGLTSQWVLPVNPCNWRTISVRYFDGLRYRVCCLRIYLCLPDDCFGSINYGFLSNTNSATFNLASSGATDATWYFDDAPQTILGTGNALVIPYPGTCLQRWISVKYKDSNGRWRICCRLIYFCNPINCGSIRIQYVENSGYKFSVDQALDNMTWILEETGTTLGTGLESAYVPVGPNCGYRTVSLRYWSPGLGWRLCCLRFYWCDPAVCGDNISFSTANNMLTMEAPDNLQQVSWFKDATIIGTSNPLQTSLSGSATHKIYIRYFDPCDQAWRWCCKIYSPGGSNTPLTFDLEDNICGEVNQIVEIPLRVRGFKNVKNFQFSVSLSDPSKGELIEIRQRDIVGDFSSSIINTSTGGVSWDNQTALSLSDHTIIAVLRIKILSASSGQTQTMITNTPIPIYAEDELGNEIIPLTYGGSFCYTKMVDICGKITRDDQVPVGNVLVRLNGCQRFVTTSDNSGAYCFTNVPAGTSYSITASKNTNHKNGVNAGDLSAIKRHILTIERLGTPYRIIAADGKRDNRINTGDVSELRRLILGHITELPTCESWAFMDKKFVFADPDDPFENPFTESIILTDIQDDILNADLIAMKMGDVNVSNNPLFQEGDWQYDIRSVGDIYLHASSAYVPGLDTFTIDITTKLFTNIRAAQFSIHWENDKFVLHGTSNHQPALQLGTDNFFMNQATGKLGFIWDDASPVSLPNDAILFSLKFTSNFPQVSMSEISFSEDPVNYYFENVDSDELNVITSSGSVTVPTKHADADEELIIYPNPNTGKFNIIGLRGQVDRLEIQDSRGSMIYSIEDVSSEQIKELQISASGLYFIRILQGEKSFTRRVLVIKEK